MFFVEAKIFGPHCIVAGGAVDKGVGQMPYFKNVLGLDVSRFSSFLKQPKTMPIGLTGG